MFELKPLELSDFSGGMTDNFMKGGPTHFLYGDNFWLTVNKKLRERDGTRIFDSVATNIPSNNLRVSGLYTYINETILLAQCGRSIYQYNPGVAFTEILGPAGAQAMGAGDPGTPATTAEWARQIYFTNEDQPLPTRIYRDENNTFQARTAGFPQTLGLPNLNYQQVLNNAINLANAIRTSMISHISDLLLHASIDYVALNYFVAQIFPAGSEQPPAGVTPAPAATSLSTLFSLVGNLNAAYEHQRADASLNGERVYHINTYSFTSAYTSTLGPTGMHVHVQNSATPAANALNLADPTGLYTAAAQVDDLAQKWYWHQLAVWTHAGVNISGSGYGCNDYATIGRYLVTAPKTGIVTQGQPVPNPNLGDLYNFVNNCKYLFNTHVEAGGTASDVHTFADGANSLQPFRINLPDCNSYDSMANLIFWLRCLYSLHWDDVGTNSFRTVTFTCTQSSTTLSALYYTTTGNTSPLQYLSYYLYSAIWTGVVPSAYITMGASGAATSKIAALSGGTAVAGQITISQYHIALDSNGNQVDTTVTTFLPAANSELSSQIDAVGADAITWLAYGSELFYCLAAHMNDAGSHVPPVQPVTDENFTIPYGPLFVPDVASYSYAFIWQNLYTVEPNGVEYESVSNPIYIAAIETSTIIPPAATFVSPQPTVWPNVTYGGTPQGVTITNLPVLTNNANTNYDTTNTTLNVYRTTDGGDTWYQVASLANGTTSYTDVTADEVSYTGYPALTGDEDLYTTGGVIGYDQPPQCSSICYVAGFMYFAGIILDGQSLPYRIQQSAQNNPEAAPQEFYDDLEDEVVCVTSARNIPIALCSHSVYRIEGNFTSLGQGSMTHIRYSDTTGCISPTSVVKTEVGTFFAGFDGFYYTDGYGLIKISIDLNARYQSFTQSETQQKRIFGTYDKYNRRVYWALQSTPSDTNPDYLWIYYLDFGIKPDGAFTTFVNPGWFRPASVVWFQGTVVYGHELGYVMCTDPNVKTDPQVEIGTSPAAWNTVYLPYNYASCAMDFGTQARRKYTPKMNLMGDNVGNVLAQITSIKDNRGDIPGLLAMVNYTFNPRWGDALILWGQSDYTWQYDHKLDEWRRFPSGNLRCNTRQIIIQPAFGGVYRYDDWPEFSYATTTLSSLSITIATPTGYTAIYWPSDCANYEIAFDSDGYVQTWLITAVSGNTLTVADPNLLLTTLSGRKWVIRGYKKNQRAFINTMTIHYDFVAERTHAYPGPQGAGENTT